MAADGEEGQPPMAEDADLVAEITGIVRASDEEFESVGGSTRHWVRECFLPRLEGAGWKLVRDA